MQIASQVIEQLNGYLAIELTGHRQYLRNSRSCAHWGLERLAAIEYDYATEEMQHAARLADQILLIEGQPDFAAACVLAPAATAIEQLAQDHALVARACEFLAESIAVCENAGDYASRELLVEMLDDEQRHIDWLETELEQARRIGEPNYLQSQLCKYRDDKIGSD